MRFRCNCAFCEQSVSTPVLCALHSLGMQPDSGQGVLVVDVIDFEGFCDSV